jgi:hypothetical protein
MNDNEKWSMGPYRIVYNNYPTYNWSLQPQQWVYENASMMEAIERSLETMDTYPDAENIINKVKSS